MYSPVVQPIITPVLPYSSQCLAVGMKFNELDENCTIDSQLSYIYLFNFALMEIMSHPCGIHIKSDWKYVYLEKLFFRTIIFMFRFLFNPHVFRKHFLIYKGLWRPLPQLI